LIEGILANLQEAQARRAKIADLGEANRQALQRRVDGLARRLSNPDLEPLAEKVLIQQLNQATRELEDLTQAKAHGPTLRADVAFYADLKKQPELLATLPATWGDEPMAWRRDWIRRFIERVSITRMSRGRFAIALHWKDGAVESQRITTRAGLTDQELTLIRQLWHDEERPRVGWCEWMRERLAAAGFERTPAGIYRAKDVALKQARAVSEAERALLRRLWNDPDRPVKGWCAWVRVRLAGAGYHRTASAVYQLVAPIQAEATGGVQVESPRTEQ
jgi:hypothetical protein